MTVPGRLVDAAPLLMTPGPTRVPARVLAAGARPMIHHRSDEFSDELAQLLALIRPLFGAAQPVLLLPATGRGAMEAAICNLFSPGDELAVCANGRFGELWARLAEAFGVVPHRVATDWTRSVDPAEVDAVFVEFPNTRAVALTYSDTSTGVANDVEAVARIARARGALVLVDAVSAIGGMPFAFDTWGIDVAVTASQKCLMSSPGLAFVAMSDRAWAESTTARLPRHYWDLAEVRQSIAKPRPATPGTAAVHVVLQVAEALRMIHDEGLDRVFARHQAMADCARRGLAALGLCDQCPGLAAFSPTLTAVAAPAGVSPASIRAGLRSHGILVAEALGPFDATAFRIGHMGDIRVEDVERTLAALAAVLRG